MKKHLITLTVLSLITLTAIFGFKGGETPAPQDQFEWKQVTTIESVVKAGLGRSRMISTDETGKMEEEKLQNFFSVSGINFGNVMENDLKITDMVSKMATEGWELYDVTSGVYASDKSTGIFITRYLFKRAK